LFLEEERKRTIVYLFLDFKDEYFFISPFLALCNVLEKLLNIWRWWIWFGERSAVI